jgi:uncharacterized membrane protein HdeD (DUF308 family)
MSNALAGTLEVLTHNWWSLFVRGAAAILFGAAVFLSPELTLDGLAVLFAAYVIVDGALTLVAGIQERARGLRRGPLLLEGIAGIGVGALTLLWSERTVLSLLWLIGAWAIAVGVLQILAVMKLGRYRRGEHLLGLAGIVSAVFGVVLVVAPIAGLSVLGVSIALYALGWGGLLIALGRRFRTRARRSALTARGVAAPGAVPAAEVAPHSPTPVGR